MLRGVAYISIYLVILLSSVQSKPCAKENPLLRVYMELPDYYEVKEQEKGWYFVASKMPWPEAWKYCSVLDMNLLNLEDENKHSDLKKFFLKRSTNPKQNWQLWTSKIDEECFDIYESRLLQGHDLGDYSIIPACDGTCGETRLTRLEDSDDVVQIKNYNVPCALEKYPICEFDLPKECENEKITESSQE